MHAVARAFCLSLLTAAYAAAATPLVDGLGRTVSLGRPAARIVSLSPSCTEVLFAIGAADNIVAVTSYCNYPSEALSKPKVGGFSGKSVSLESIVAFRPDLVVVEGQMHERIVAMLSQANIPCYAANALRLEDSYRIIEQLGSLTGHDATAAKVSTDMRERIGAVSRAAAERNRAAGSEPTAFWLVWDDPLMTAGRPTFINDAIAAAGGRNVFADAREQYPAVSFESLIARNPEWILSGTDHGARINVRSLAVRQGWRSLKAVREGRIALLDADSINRAGPRLADAIETLARIFHPEPR